MLETLREYALECLEESALGTDVRRAHAIYYRGFAEQAEAGYFGPTEGACLDLLQQDYGNLRAAIEWTLDAPALEVGLPLAGALGGFSSLRSSSVGVTAASPPQCRGSG
jgi:predicted ATPase